MKKVEYYIYNPGGNKTALVINEEYNLHEKKVINNIILKKHADIEQVGFVNRDSYELQMAGGEFCGNATRCAAGYYFNICNIALKESEKINSKVINIKVSGMKEKIKAGINNDGCAWAEIPVEFVQKAEKGINIVKLQGITHIVIDEEESKKYLKAKESIKEKAQDIIEKLGVEDSAVGVMFTEIKENIVSLYPHCMGKKHRYTFL